jgi:Aspartyl protease
MTARKLPVFAFFALASALAASALAADGKNCQLRKYGDIEFMTTAGGAVMLPVIVNGKPGRMVLNTGSAYSIFFPRAMSQLSLSPHHLSTANGIQYGGRPVTEAADFRSLVLGSVSLGNGTFILLPKEVKVPDDDVVGLLAVDAFSHVDFELDLAHNRLSLFSQEHCPGIGAYWSEAYASMPMLQGSLGDWYVPMELEGKKVAASLSTGRPDTTLTTDVTRKLYGFDEKSAGVETEADATGNGTHHQFRAMQFTAPGLTLKNSIITLEPAAKCALFTGAGTNGMATYGNSCAGAYPMHIGRRVLEQLRLYFATKEKMLYFTAADTGK